MSDILDVPKLAELLGKTKAGIRAMAASGTLPGRKVCGEWTFYRPAILDWLSQPYNAPCQPSTSKPVRPTGISVSLSAAKDLDRLLARPTGKRRKSTQTRSQPDHGGRRS